MNSRTSTPDIRDHVFSQSGMGPFERFLREQRDALIHFLRRRTASFEDAEDIAQESLSRLMRYQQFHSDGDWKPLLYRIASNAAHDQVRQVRSRNMALFELDEREWQSGASLEESPEERLHHEQELAQIQRIILALPPRCREVYLLSRFDAMSYAHIAERLNISKKAVEKHMTRALAALRDGVGRKA